MTILDHRGNPINLSKLLDDDDDAELDESPSLLWWENARTVATGLTPARAAALLRAVDDGDDIHSFMTLAEEIEERDQHYFTCARNRKIRMSASVPVVDSPIDGDDEIHEAVTERIAKWPQLGELVYRLLDGIAKGYSVVEIVWYRDIGEWYPIGIRWRRPEYYRFNKKGIIRRVDSLENLRWSQGKDLEPGKYVIHVPLSKEGRPVRNGLARLGLGSFICKTFNQKDLQRFIELYGMPARIGRYEGELNTKQRRRLLAATIALGHDAAAILPKSQEIELLDGRRGSDVETFLKSATWWNQETSKMWLGGTMTTDAGSSKSQATVHETVSDQIAIFDATGVALAINRDLVRTFVDLNFGPQKRYHRLRWPMQIRGDLTKFTAAISPLIDRGARISERWVLETIGAPSPTDDERLLTSRPSGAPQADSSDTPGDTTPDPEAVADDPNELEADAPSE